MKKTYEAPVLETTRFTAEDLLSVSAVFTAFSAEYDNEGAYKWNNG